MNPYNQYERSEELQVSPSRTYVALCFKSVQDGDRFLYAGFRFRKFTLPEDAANSYARNDVRYASWYFLNCIDLVAYIDKVVTWEDYHDIQDAVP